MKWCFCLFNLLSSLEFCTPPLYRFTVWSALFKWVKSFMFYMSSLIWQLNVRYIYLHTAVVELFGLPSNAALCVCVWVQACSHVYVQYAQVSVSVKWKVCIFLAPCVCEIERVSGLCGNGCELLLLYVHTRLFVCGFGEQCSPTLTSVRRKMCFWINTLLLLAGSATDQSPYSNISPDIPQPKTNIWRERERKIKCLLLI